MNRFIQFLAVILAISVLPGCAAVTGVKSGNPDNINYIRDTVVVGKTTMKEVREKAGEPNGQEQRGDGSVVLTYKASATSGFYSMMGSSLMGKELNMGKMQSATILFDPNGVAIGVSGSDVDGGKTSSFSRGVPVNAYGMSFQGQPPAVVQPQQPAQAVPQPTPASAITAPASGQSVAPAEPTNISIKKTKAKPGTKKPATTATTM